MPIITGLQKPPEDNRKPTTRMVEPSDLFRVKGDYRFTGYQLPMDENGQINMDWRNISEPAFWSFRATSIGFSGLP